MFYSAAVTRRHHAAGCFTVSPFSSCNSGATQTGPDTITLMEQVDNLGCLYAEVPASVHHQLPPLLP